MTTPRNDIVRLRLTTLEKQDWSRAAGGTRKLSEWIRSVCNAEVAATIPNVKPQLVEDAIERELQRPIQEPERSALAGEDQAHLESGSMPATPVLGADLSEDKRTSGGGVGASQCPRWMHHRKGVYCGACKRVIGVPK